MIRQLTIFGVGLIGGSLARALRGAGFCETVVGCSRSAEHLQRAVDLGVIDRYTLDPVEAVSGADMILLAVPLRAMPTILTAIAGSIEPDAVLTDAGSVKGSVIRAVEQAFDGQVPTNFVPGHPIAGKEKSSVEAADAGLYIDHKVLLTPLPDTNPQAVKRVTEMWQIAGAKVELLEAKHHDDVLAATSHLPHVLAYSLVNTLSKSEYGDEVFSYAAGGFKSFTRIASSDPVMWRDICLDNRDAILASLNDFQQDLSDLANLIDDGNGEALLELFTQAKYARDTHLEN